MLVNKILSGVKRPRAVQVERVEEDPYYACFSVYPLDRGYGYTLGNSLRRILLTSTYGYAIVAFKVTMIDEKGVKTFLTSEYQNIPGVRETTLELIARFKALSLGLSNGQEEFEQTYTFKGEQVITAGQLAQGPVQVFNDEEFLVAHVLEDAHFEVTLYLEYGVGYRDRELESETPGDVHAILVDAIHTPVKKVAFSVEKARIGAKADYDKLILQIWTNGSITAEDVLSQAALLAKEHFEAFISMEILPEASKLLEEDQKNEPFNDVLDMKVQNLDLSVRALNCLKKANITSIWDLISKTESEIAQTKSFGKKSLEEIKTKLAERNLILGLFSKEQAYKLLRGEKL